MSSLRTAIALGIAVTLVACGETTTGPGHSNRVDRRFSWEGPVARSQRIEIRGINGSIRGERTTGGTAVIDATIYGSAEWAGDVVVEVVEHAEGITVCARYPDRDGWLIPCVPDQFPHGNIESHDVRVEFTVGVPDGVTLDANTINGSVDADVTGDVFASAVNGNIEIVTDGIAGALTVNGSIDASLGATSWDRSLRFTTVNGSVRVAIRSGADVRVDGSTVNGHAASDFPLTVTNTRYTRSIRGTLGAGTWGLTLSTVNGDVSLRRYR